MNELGLPEPLQSKDIIVGSQGVIATVDTRRVLANQTTSLVDSLVLV